MRMRASARIDLVARARRARRDRGDHRGRHSGQERHRADPQRRAGARRRSGRIRRPAGGGDRGRTLDQARAAAKLVEIDYEPLPAVLTVEEAVARESYVSPPQMMVARRGRARARVGAPHRLSGELRCGGQDHFYLEGPDRARHPRRRRRHAGAELDPAPDRGAARRRASARRCRSTPSRSRCGAWAARSAARRARRPSSPASPRCSPGRRGGR